MANNPNNPMAGYLLVQNALRSLRSSAQLGFTANAKPSWDEWYNEDESEEEGPYDELQAALSKLKAAAPSAVGGLVQISDSDRSTTLTVPARPKP